MVSSMTAWEESRDLALRVCVPCSCMVPVWVRRIHCISQEAELRMVASFPVGAGNQMCVLCKQSERSTAEPSIKLRLWGEFKWR